MAGTPYVGPNPNMAGTPYVGPGGNYPQQQGYAPQQPGYRKYPICCCLCVVCVFASLCIYVGVECDSCLRFLTLRRSAARLP